MWKKLVKIVIEFNFFCERGRGGGGGEGGGSE